MTPKRTVAAGAAGLVIALTAGGCQLFFPTDLPTPEPSQTAVSSPSESNQERIIRLDREAAMAAYKAFNDEFNRLGMAGGATKATTILKENATGHYLRFNIDGLRYLRQKGVYADGPAVTTVSADGGWSPTEIGLTACEDASKVRLISRDGQEFNKSRPKRFVQTLTAKKVDGRWKIADLESKIVKNFKNEGECRGL